MGKAAILLVITGLMSVGVSHAAQVNGFANGFTVEDTAGVITTGNNFTMLDPIGGLVGGAADVLMTWDGTVFTASSDYAGPGSVTNMTLDSMTSFFGFNWTAHDIQVFAPGSYSFNTLEGPVLSMNVGPSQLGAHMLFDWSVNLNIDVAVVWDANGVFPSTEFGGGVTPWESVSVDGNGNGIPSISMIDGPFVGFNANFNLNGITPTSVPVPAAAWLFCSGLMGVLGVARYNKT